MLIAKDWRQAKYSAGVSCSTNVGKATLSMEVKAALPYRRLYFES